MKVFFTLASLGSGGSERVVSLLANSMSERGHEVEIICLKYIDSYYQVNKEVKVAFLSDEVSSKGNDEGCMPYRHVIASRSTVIGKMCWLRRYCMQNMPDVVIAFTEGVYCATIVALLGTGIKVIASERNDPRYMSIKRNIVKSLILPYSDWLVVQTEAIRKQFKGKIAEKISVIVNPVREEVWHGESDYKVKRIITVARLFPQKRLELAIRAFSIIARKYPDWSYVIYGDGPEKQALSDLISEFGLNGQVCLAGKTSQIVDELRRSSIFFMSSDYEGMSNSMVEAVCVGLPVVSTKVSGTDELVDEGKNGYVVEMGDVNGLANALDRLMGDSDRIEQFAKESREKSNLFRISRITDEWERLINHCVNK
ncbi:MAG: glycosyltransferase family 4 protein [Prevotella sp.]